MNNSKNNFIYSLNKNKNSFKFKTRSKIIFIIFLIFFLILSFFLIGFQIAPRGFDVFVEKLISFFKFKNSLNEFKGESLILLSIEYLFISIKSVLIGTTIGFLASMMSSFLLNEKIFRIKYLSTISKIFVGIIRSIPVIFFIFFFKLSFSKNIAFVLLIFWFTWIWSHKYMMQIYETTNYNFYENLILNGFSKINSFRIAIIPQIKNKFISLFMYSYESNIRWNSLLGALGLIGIGELVNLSSNNQYESMGIPILTILLFVLFLELITFVINKFLLNKKSVVFNNNLEKIKNEIKLKKILKIFLLICLLSFVIYCFLTFDWTNDFNINSYFLESIFTPNWNIINENDNNLFVDILTLISQTFVIMFISLVFSYFLMFFSSKILFKNSFLISSIIASLIRSLPIIFLIYLISPIFTSPISSICVILGIYSSTTITKNMTHNLNDVDKKIINYYKLIGYSRIAIFNKYLLVNKRINFLENFLFEWESKYRDLVSYGYYGVSAIGMYIDEFEKGSQYSNMAVYIWISFFITIISIFTNFIIFLLYKNKFKNLIFKGNL